MSRNINERLHLARHSGPASAGEESARGSACHDRPGRSAKNQIPTFGRSDNNLAATGGTSAVENRFSYARSTVHPSGFDLALPACYKTPFCVGACSGTGYTPSHRVRHNPIRRGQAHHSFAGLAVEACSEYRQCAPSAPSRLGTVPHAGTKCVDTF